GGPRVRGAGGRTSDRSATRPGRPATAGRRPPVPTRAPRRSAAHCSPPQYGKATRRRLWVPHYRPHACRRTHTADRPHRGCTTTDVMRTAAPTPPTGPTVGAPPPTSCVL